MKTIWSPGAIPTDEWKYRNLKRVWLPMYYAVAVIAGVIAVVQGSPVLNELFMEPVVNLLGVTMSLVAMLCLIGVAFPKLWAVEFASVILLVGIVASYVTEVLLFASTPPQTYFTALMLTLSLPDLLSRVGILGEEIKERRAKSE